MEQKAALCGVQSPLPPFHAPPRPQPQAVSRALSCLCSRRESSARSRPCRGPSSSLLFLVAGNLDITPDDPRWIGAWWGGFLLCGALLFFSSLLMFGFPQSLPPHSDPAMESEQAMLPEREYERPKPSNGVLRHPLEPDSSASCFQQLKGSSALDVAGGGGQSDGGARPPGGRFAVRTGCRGA